MATRKKKQDILAPSASDNPVWAGLKSYGRVARESIRQGGISTDATAAWRNVGSLGASQIAKTSGYNTRVTNSGINAGNAAARRNANQATVNYLTSRVPIVGPMKLAYRMVRPDKAKPNVSGKPGLPAKRTAASVNRNPAVKRSVPSVTAKKTSAIEKTRMRNAQRQNALAQQGRSRKSAGPVPNTQNKPIPKKKVAGTGSRKSLSVNSRKRSM